MTRYFTHEEATRLLPVIRQSLREAQNQRAGFLLAESVLTEQKQRIAMAGGTSVNLNRIHALRDQRENALGRLKSAVEEITTHGVQIKDLEAGLLDFPTVYRDREVLMCWRAGEDAIEFWHGTEDGFAGRRPIDRDFLEHHRGDPGGF
jgi:hypothetical protein